MVSLRTPELNVRDLHIAAENESLTPGNCELCGKAWEDRAGRGSLFKL